MTTLTGAPLRRIEVDRGKVRTEDWPFTIPAVRELVENGFEPAPGLTVLIGENGSGKSTLVEAIASAWSRHVGAHRRNVSLAATARPSDEDSNLDRALRLLGTRGGGKGGFFLRAEKMDELFTAIGAEGLWADRFGGVDLHARSHGQAFLQVLRTRVVGPGLYLFDEPEAALSFTSCLGLIALLAQIPSEGSQAIVATHSPLIAATPGATLIEVGEWGMRTVAYEDLALVRSWRDFLANPERFVKYLGPG
ncbi:MAG TPA: AAA family ATPase [Candidatus Dormibacteraeota bacterium]